MPTLVFVFFFLKFFYIQDKKTFDTPFAPKCEVNKQQLKDTSGKCYLNLYLRGSGNPSL